VGDLTGDFERARPSRARALAVIAWCVVRWGPAVLVLVWLAGCDSPDALPAPPPETSGAMSGATESTGAAETTQGMASTAASEDVSDGDQPKPDLPSECGQYLDEPEHDAEIRITNASASDVYLFDIDGCSSIESVWQVQTEDGGLWPTPCGPGMTACETVLGQACTSRWCTLACYQRSGIRLLPRATYAEPFEGLTRIPITLPPECAGGCENEECRQGRRLLDAEHVGVAIAVVTSPTCFMGMSCECDPGLEGWCETPVPEPGTVMDEIVLQATMAGGIIEATFGP
jgi:hypothetical protein